MPPSITSLQAHETLCDGTAAVYFEKPNNFEFRAGQFANFTLLHPADTDLQGNTRALSIASAPHERNLMVAVRMRGTAFKRNLMKLPRGAQVLLQGPYGELSLSQNASRPAVLLAGGIGITPFRSILWHAAESQSPRTIFLFYSVRRPEEAAFLEELRELEHRYDRYKLICTVTQPEKSGIPWRGKTGYISHEMISEWIPNLTAPVYFIAGPPGMVTSMHQMLTAAGVSEGDIRAEEFAGYS